MISNKSKKRLSLLLVTLVLGVNIFCCSTVVFAEPDSLNEIGGTQQTVEAPVTPSTSAQQNTNTQATNNSTVSDGNTSSSIGSSGNVSADNQSSAAAVGEIFRQGGLTQESVEKSAKWVEPVAKIINLLMAIVLGIFSALLVFVSVLDMVYIGLPFTRKYLCPNAQVQQGGAGASPMGMGMSGGMGIGMGMNRGMGMGSPMGGAQPAQTSGVAATIGQWISDDALNAVREAQATAAPAGGGAMGMGMGMQQQAQAPVKGKSLIFAYMKKRSFSLIMLGVCLVLFTCTIFTDLGTMLGMKLLALLSGISM